MGHIHELLACEPALEGACEKDLGRVKSNFIKRSQFYEGLDKTYQPAEEDGRPEEAQEVEMMDTVPGTIRSFLPFLINLGDAVVSKEVTNTKATADVVIGDTVLAKDLPVSALLSLEKRLTALREILEYIPTLDVGVHWAEDDQRENVYIRRPIVTYKTEKRETWTTVTPATEFHPADNRASVKDVRIGDWTAVVSSGKISSVEKSQLIVRCEKMQAAVKQARQRANGTEVEHQKVMGELCAFIFEDKKYLPA